MPHRRDAWPGAEVLRECVTPGCHRKFCSSRHDRCCSDCGEFAVHGVWQHSGRCQKHQRRLGRRAKSFIRASMTMCGTEGCARVHAPGYRVCCSCCKDSDGRSHSRRCDGLSRRQRGDDPPAAAPAAPSAISMRAPLDDGHAGTQSMLVGCVEPFRAPMGREHAGCANGSSSVTFYPCLGHASHTAGSDLVQCGMLHSARSAVHDEVWSLQPDAPQGESDSSVQRVANSAAQDFDLCAMD